MNDYYNPYEINMTDEIYDFFVNPKNKPFETLALMKLIGYEVEPNPKKYKVKIPQIDHALINDDGKIAFVTNNVAKIHFLDQQYFTKEELKKIRMDWVFDLGFAEEVIEDDTIC